MKRRGDTLDRLRKAKKVEPRKFYAKVYHKDAPNKYEPFTEYWKYEAHEDRLIKSDKEDGVFHNIVFTLYEWNEMGVDDNNAIFEEV